MGFRVYLKNDELRLIRSFCSRLDDEVAEQLLEKLGWQDGTEDMEHPSEWPTGASVDYPPGRVMPATVRI